jgi:hypothetical protein
LPSGYRPAAEGIFLFRLRGAAGSPGPALGIIKTGLRLTEARKTFFRQEKENKK